MKTTIVYYAMPESNGKTNWSVSQRRVDPSGLGLGSMASGVMLWRGEHYGQGLYFADRMRFLIGERRHEPNILLYDAVSTTAACHVHAKHCIETARAHPYNPAMAAHYGEQRVHATIDYDSGVECTAAGVDVFTSENALSFDWTAPAECSVTAIKVYIGETLLTTCSATHFLRRGESPVITL